MGVIPVEPEVWTFSSRREKKATLDFQKTSLSGE